MPGLLLMACLAPLLLAHVATLKCGAKAKALAFYVARLLIDIIYYEHFAILFLPFNLSVKVNLNTF